MRKRGLDKKAYFFIIDSVLALSVLAVGAFLVFAFYAQQPSSTQPDILSEDIMAFFSNTKMKDINSPELGLGGSYWSSNEVKTCNNGNVISPDSESTVLQQIGIFYKLKGKAGKDCYVNVIANGFVAKFVQNILPLQYKFEFWIKEGVNPKTLIYPREESLESKSSSKVVIPSRKIAYGIFDSKTGEVFGPYLAEVWVWQQNTK